MAKSKHNFHIIKPTGRYYHFIQSHIDFHTCMVEKYPDLERGESSSKTGRKHIPTRLFKQAVNLSKQAKAIEKGKLKDTMDRAKLESKTYSLLSVTTT